MSAHKVERVQQLARVIGLEVSDADMTEVANRLDSLLGELESLRSLDLAGITPLPVFPDEGDDGQ